jgi:hypothetical protein
MQWKGLRPKVRPLLFMKGIPTKLFDLKREGFIGAEPKLFSIKK